MTRSPSIRSFVRLSGPRIPLADFSTGRTLPLSSCRAISTHSIKHTFRPTPFLIITRSSRVAVPLFLNFMFFSFISPLWTWWVTHLRIGVWTQSTNPLSSIHPSPEPFPPIHFLQSQSLMHLVLCIIQLHAMFHHVPSTPSSSLCIDPT